MLARSAGVAVLAVSLALAGCGAGNPERAEVSSVAHQYIAAFASGNGEQACSLLTGDAEQRFVRSGTFLRFLSHRSGPVLTCPEEIKLLHRLLGPDRFAALCKAKVTVRSLSDSKADAEVAASERLFVVPLLKGAARWLIAEAVVPEASVQELLRASTNPSRSKALPPLTRRTETSTPRQAQRSRPTPQTVMVKPLHALGDRTSPAFEDTLSSEAGDVHSRKSAGLEVAPGADENEHPLVANLVALVHHEAKVLQGAQPGAPRVRHVCQPYPASRFGSVGIHVLNLGMRPVTAAEIAPLPVRVDRAHEVQVLRHGPRSIPQIHLTRMRWCGDAQRDRTYSTRRAPPPKDRLSSPLT
jgi:hypothetical protein